MMVGDHSCVEAQKQGRGAVRDRKSWAVVGNSRQAEQGVGDMDAWSKNGNKRRERPRRLGELAKGQRVVPSWSRKWYRGGRAGPVRL